MSRELSADFEKLKKFILDYNLSDNAKKREFDSRLIIMHKKLFGYLTFLSELEFVNSKENLIIEESLIYLKECGSDLAQALFCWINGAYKPATFMLRSSIETFLKGLAGNKDKSIFIEKSMYKVLELAESSSYFNDIATNYFVVLKDNYRQLCITTHSGDITAFNPLSTLKLLPIYDLKLAKQFSNYYVTILDNMLGTVFMNFYTFIYKMHPYNQINFFETLTNSMKNEVIEFKTK